MSDKELFEFLKDAEFNRDISHSAFAQIRYHINEAKDIIENETANKEDVNAEIEAQYRKDVL
jgi:hypothetical protein